METHTILSGFQLCWNVGKVLIECCKRWKAAEQEISERVVLVENAWHRTRLQMEFVEGIEPPIDENFRRVLDDSFGILATKLSEAIKRINDALKHQSKKRPGFLEFASKVNKPKYVLLKSTIDEAINTIELWQRQVDPPWFMIMRLSNNSVDKTLRRLVERKGAEDAKVIGGSSSPSEGIGGGGNMRLPLQVAEGMREVLRREPRTEIHVSLSPRDLESRPILYSTSRIARPRNAHNAKWLIIDSVNCRPGASPDALKRDVRILARKLSKADPLSFGLLNCMGVIKVPEREAQGQGQPASFDLVFRCPDGMEVLQCLRQKMLDNPAVVSLSRRMTIAKELARSVSYVHTFNFVHKNIRPESILLFENLDAARSLTFLVGFDNFRSADGHTNLRSDKEWYRNIYRHPLRQGEFLVEEYKMHHDIYSLGVCLLEIGLWESFVSYGDPDPALHAPGPRLNDYQSWLEKNGHRSDLLVTCYLKDYFTDLAKSVLPQMTGDRYASVVVSCLTCLEEGSSDFGDVDKSQDRDGILLGVRFIQRILMRLEGVVV